MENQFTEKKSFGLAVLIWLFTAGIGGHKIYIEERFHYIFWYWAFAIVTLGLGPLISVFFIKRRILVINNSVNRNNKSHSNL